MTPRSISAAIAVLCLALASCSDSDSSAPADAQPDAESASDADQAEDSAGAAADDISDGEPPLDSGAVESITTAFDEVRAFLSQWHSGDRQPMAECLYDAGFPQDLELLELEARAEALRSSAGSRLTIRPEQTGPYTESQAREFGMLGPLWLSSELPSEPGKVVSTDPAYHAAAEACIDENREQFDQVDDAAVRSISAASHDLGNAIRSRFARLIRNDPGLETLNVERLACVRDSGYPDLDPAGSSPWDAALSELGIEKGTEIEREIPDQNVRQLEEGEVGPDPVYTKAIPSWEVPRGQNTYVPSAGEVQFALAYVDCGEQVDFLERHEQLQIPIRAAVLAEFETEIIGLRERLQELLDG